MIKYCKFTFIPVKSDDYWVSFPAFGECTSAELDTVYDYHDVAIHLDQDKAYQVSLDQSTTNTGLFIKDYQNSEAYMVEISRSKDQDVTDYIYDLEMLLHDIFMHCTITHVIYERPINTGSFRSSQALFQLEGMLKSLGKRYPEFRAAKLDHIENSSWRAVIIDKSLDSVYTRKEQSRISVNNLFPWTQQYGYSLKADEDIFEAIGVMMGWFYNSFDHLGRPYVRGDRTKRTVGVLVLPGMKGQKVYDMLKEKEVPCRFAVENPKYSIYQNLCSMIEPYDALCVEISNPYTMLCICIESNIVWADFEVMTVILSDASCVDPTLREISGGSFQFVI